MSAFAAFSADGSAKSSTLSSLSSRGRSPTMLLPKPMRNPAKTTETIHISAVNELSGTRKVLNMVNLLLVVVGCP